MIDILLAAYNGERYIGEQIESILGQTYQDWFLYIKDDCSTDGTLNIALKYEKKYSEKIRVIRAQKPSGSARNNFFSMIGLAGSSYIMTCDQDDVWLPDKIETTYRAMKEAESKDSHVPVLVHTDLKVTDDDLNIISPSLFKMQDLDCRRDRLNNLLTQNIVTGCTVMINRSLAEYIKQVPRQAVMHDWWMALIASALGKIVFIDKSTVLYRQHKGNQVGAKNVKSLEYILKRINSVESIKSGLRDTYIQAGGLLEAMGKYMNEYDYDMVKEYSSLIEAGKLQKLKTLKKYGFWKNNFTRKLGQLFFC